MKIIYWIGSVIGYLYTIKSPGKINLALTITNNSVGWTKYDSTSQDQKLEMIDNTISRNNKKVCSSSSSSEVRLCISQNPINAEFEPISLGNSVKFKTKGNHVLAIGDFNENTEMYDVIVLEESQSHQNKFFFSVELRDSELQMKPFSSSQSNKK